jgi:hypothetical protein
MRTAFLLALTLLWSPARAQVPDACEWQTLLQQVAGKTAIDSVPPIPRSDRGRFVSISLYEPMGAIDQYLYSALVDPISGQAWVRRYGGLTGAIVWFGPTSVAAERLASCPVARYPVWFG